MKSTKKMAALIVALVAVMAVVLPAVASASRFDYSDGKLVPKGTAFTASSSNFTFQTSLGLMTCSEVLLRGALTENASSVKAVNHGPISTSNCWSSKPFVLEGEMTSLNLSSPTSGTMGLKFTAKFSWGTCQLENSAAPVTYTSGSSNLKMVKANMKVTPAACGPFLLSADFSNIKDLKGQAIIIQ